MRFTYRTITRVSLKDFFRPRIDFNEGGRYLVLVWHYDIFYFAIGWKHWLRVWHTDCWHGEWA